MTIVSKRLIVDSWVVTGWRLPVLAILTFASALLEGATIASLLPLLSSLSGTSSSSTNRILNIFDAMFEKLGLSVTPATIGAMIILLIVASAAVFLTQSYLASRLQALYVASWQKRLLSAFLAADYSFFLRQRTGDLTAAIVTEPTRLGLVFSQAILVVAGFLFICVQVVISLFIAQAVVAIILVFGALLFLLTRPFARRALTLGTDLTSVNSDLTVDTNEVFSGVKFIKATATEGRAFGRLASAVDRLEVLSYWNSLDGQIVKAIFEYSGGFLVVGLLIIGPVFFNVDVGAILVTIAMFVRLFPKVTGLRQSMQIVDFHLPAFEAARRLLDDADRQRELVLDDNLMERPKEGPAAIALDRLSVTIGERTILDNVSLDIPAGAFAVLTGQTGAGKTTLLDCVIGLRKPTGGRVIVDGEPLELISSAAWRRSIGYLGQDPILFNSSIRDNMRWIRPGTTDDEMRAALHSAAAEFVERLPLGLDTIVGEHGSKLSGGERQRIALARALIGSPRLLVLDEATSALDAETEELVTGALASLKGRLTIVAISHRPALVREADVRLDLGNGCAEIVEVSRIF